MLTLLPAILLFLAAGLVLVFHRIRPNFGSAWLVSILASLGALGLLIAHRWLLPTAVESQIWLPTNILPLTIRFEVDRITWVYGISILGLLNAILFTAHVRLQYRSNPLTWSANLAVAGAALLAILSANPLTLVLTWTALDLVDLGASIAANADVRISRAAIVAFLFRLAGTFLLIWAMVESQAIGENLQLGSAQTRAGFFVLLAIGLRLGVLPLSLPYFSEALRRRGIGSMVRLAGPAASLGLLARLPETVAPLGISTILLALVGLAVVYGAGMWLFSSDEVTGRQYWVIALAGMAFGSVIRGQPQASLAWGMALVLTGGLLFLFSTRPAAFFVLPILGMVGLTGLPFTPSASGWAGMVVLPFTLPDLLFLLAHAMLLVGYIRHSLRSGDPPSQTERWTQVAYTWGLTLMVGLGWMIGVLGWEGSFTIGVWWASLASTLLAVLFGAVAVLFQKRGGNFSQIQRGWIWRFSARLGGVLSAMLRLNWLYRFFWWIFGWLQRLVGLISDLLEGAGGVLWVLVLLVLLITVLQANLQ